MQIADCESWPAMDKNFIGWQSPLKQNEPAGVFNLQSAIYNLQFQAASCRRTQSSVGKVMLQAAGNHQSCSRGQDGIQRHATSAQPAQRTG
jgi:hypothetical protein